MNLIIIKKTIVVYSIVFLIVLTGSFFMYLNFKTCDSKKATIVYKIKSKKSAKIRRKAEILDKIEKIIKKRLGELSVSDIKIAASKKGNVKIEFFYNKTKQLKLAKKIISKKGEMKWKLVLGVSSKKSFPLKSPKKTIGKINGKVLLLSNVKTLDGKYIRKANCRNNGVYIILNKTGKERLKKLTKKYINRKLAFVIDNKPVQVVRITEPIENGKLYVTGIKERKKEVSILLNFDPLPTKIYKVKEKITEPLFCSL